METVKVILDIEGEKQEYNIPARNLGSVVNLCKAIAIKPKPVVEPEPVEEETNDEESNSETEGENKS